MAGLDAASDAVGFIQSLSHTKGKWAGVKFTLADWQREDIIEPLFGTLNPDGTRQYRTAYIEIPRKNGKSQLCAAIALKLLLADGEQGAEIYIVAADRDQASIVFNVAAEMVRRNKVLMRKVKIIDSVKRIVFPKMGSFLRAIPADVAGSYGYNAHAIIADELHVWPKRDLWDALTTSTGARTQPLVVAITTAGYDRTSICWEQHEYAAQVIKGTINDPTFFGYIRAAPEKADWKDEKVWYECNPALGDFRSIDEMRSMAKRAEHTPALQNTFKRLYLNQWTQQVDRWIDIDLWDSQRGTIDEESLRGQECYGMLDLATVSDMTAWVMAFPHKDDHVDILARFFCPQAKLTDSSNRYRDQYQVWADKGFLTVTPGNATDYAFVRQQVIDDAAKFRLVDMNVDRLFQAHQIAQELAEEGITVVGMGMGFLSFAAPMKDFERRLLGRKLHHGGNPIMRWMADNVAVKQDPTGNLKPDKTESQGKIDGIVGIVGALDRLMLHEEAPRSRFEEEGEGIVAV